MEPAVAGAIDCDVHPAVPSVRSLLPHLDPYWRDAFVVRGQDGFDPADHPFGTPLACRPDFRPERGPPGSDPDRLIRQAVEAPGVRFAILNCLYGGQLALSEPMATALCRAVNDWIAAEWLARDPRLRASILVPPQDPEAAAAEIDRLAADRRFVQVLLPLTTELMLGKRFHWPIYAAAERHGLPVGIHAGGLRRYPSTPSGWPTHHLQDQVGHAQTFEAQLLSLIHQGVFVAHPGLTVVLIESGVTWLPGFLWRAVKMWRALRPEVPWVSEPPSAIVRRHVRLTIQPFDAPADAETVARVIDQIGSDAMLLFASDHPRWRYDGPSPVPPGFPAHLVRRVAVDNPLATYPRLSEAAA